MTNKRSLTLLETLIALVLVLAVGALIFPTMVDSLQERAFESAADITNEQLMLARAHAQATGEAVEVSYSAKDSQVIVRVFSPFADGFRTGEVTPGTGPLAVGEGVSDSAPLNVGASASEGANNGHLVAEPWASRPLARGVRIVSRMQNASDDDSMGNDVSPTTERDYQTLADLENDQDIRLAVFMPDGTALLGDPVWLNDQDGRCGMLTINPWSGLPLFQRLVDGALAAPESGAVAEGDDRESDSKARGDDDLNSHDAADRLFSDPAAREREGEADDDEDARPDDVELEDEGDIDDNFESSSV